MLRKKRVAGVERILVERNRDAFLRGFLRLQKSMEDEGQMITNTDHALTHSIFNRAFADPEAV